MSNEEEKTKRIISIDPGYERIGIAILEKDFFGNISLIHSECFKTSADQPFTQRLFLIGKYIEEIIEKYKPSVFSIENLFLQSNQKTVMKVSEARGVLLYIAKENNLTIYEFTPLQIKSIVTGSGKSDKLAVQKMVTIQVPQIKNKGKILDDEYDAIACGLTYFALEKSL